MIASRNKLTVTILIRSNRASMVPTQDSIKFFRSLLLSSIDKDLARSASVRHHQFTKGIVGTMQSLAIPSRTVLTAGMNSQKCVFAYQRLM